MSDAVLVGLLSLAGTVAGSLAGIFSSQRVTGYRLEQLQREVAKHNSLIDRTYRLESRMELAENELQDLKEAEKHRGCRRPAERCVREVTQ